MRLGRVKGIDVNVHWSFWMLVVFYLISTTMSGGLAAGAMTVLFVNAVFACIVLHEFGHAAAAARYGIKTADITIFAFGGLARLVKMPRVPMQEFVIALAGPAVNVAIAAALGLLMAVRLLPTAIGGVTTGEVGTSLAAEQIVVEQFVAYSFWDMLLFTNLFLVVFNLLPAFPMDGGRVLRSLLAMRLGHMRATEIAARAGRWMALIFVVLGIYYSSFSLILIAAFIFVAGTAELFQSRLRQGAEQMAAQPGASGQPFAGGGAFPGAFQASWGFNASQPPPADWQTESPSANDPGVIDADDVRKIR